MASFLSYNPDVKKLFFDRRAVRGMMDRVAYNASFWFGGQVRSRARQAVGTPVIQGQVKITASGRSRKQGYRKPRAPGKPPRARTGDNIMTLRNVQYFAKRASGDEFANATVFVPGFTRDSSHGKFVPEFQEFGGTAKIRAKVVKAYTKTGKEKIRRGVAQYELIFSRRFPYRNFRVPARPFLGPSFQKVAKRELKRKIEKGDFNRG